MSLKGKFAILTVVPLSGIVLFVALGWGAMGELTGRTDRLMREVVFPLVTKGMVTLNESQSSIKNLLEADRDLHRAKLAEKASLVASEEEEFAAARQGSTENIEHAAARMAQAGAVFDDEEKAVYEEFLALFTEWREKTTKVIAYAQDREKYKFALRISYGSAATLFDDMRGKIDQLTQMQEARIAKQLETVASSSHRVETDAEAVAGRSRWVIGFFLAMGLVVALAVLGAVLLVARSIRRPLVEAVENLSEASAGLTTASNQVAASSQGLAEGASEQAASLEETSSTLEEMASMTRQNSDNAQQADRLARDARDNAFKGQDSMADLVTAMDAIKRSSDETAKIIKTIDEIAFQTNLLALNAAVEAARAGDVGKGFAVVAEEVRNLAKRSAEAAKTTDDLIQDSQEKSGFGVEKASGVAKLLQEVNASVVKVGDLLKEVSAASDEQAKGVEQVNVGVAQMDQVTQNNAANAEETAAASQELAARAMELNQIVAMLAGLAGVASGNGNGNGAKPTPAPEQEPQPRKAAPARSLKELIVEEGREAEAVQEHTFRELEDADFKTLSV